jgi:hypothetical protein
MGAQGPIALGNVNTVEFVRHGLFFGSSAVMGGVIGVMAAKDAQGAIIGALTSVALGALFSAAQGVTVYGPTRAVYGGLGLAAGVAASYLSWTR